MLHSNIVGWKEASWKQADELIFSFQAEGRKICERFKRKSKLQQINNDWLLPENNFNDF